MKKIIYIILLIVGMVSCSKEIPQSVVEEPVFYFIGDINGEVIMKAGIDGYYMFTDYQDAGSDEVLRMNGILRHTSDSLAPYLGCTIMGYDSATNANILLAFLGQTTLNSYSLDSVNVNGQNYPRSNYKSCYITYSKDGKEYRSYKTFSKLNQSGNIVFELSHITNYENNANNQKTLKIKGTVDTWLYNIFNNSDSIHMKSSQVCFAIAYP